jgi:hypothetical protein
MGMIFRVMAWRRQGVAAAVLFDKPQTYDASTRICASVSALLRRHLVVLPVLTIWTMAASP